MAGANQTARYGAAQILLRADTARGAAEVSRVERGARAGTGAGYHETEGAMGFIKVKCEICSNDMRDRERDVTLFVYVPDRRKSFVSKALSR